jgi:hypothetical protein
VFGTVGEGLDAMSWRIIWRGLSASLCGVIGLAKLSVLAGVRKVAIPGTGCSAAKPSRSKLRLGLAGASGLSGRDISAKTEQQHLMEGCF